MLGMSSPLHPPGDDLRRALAFISDERSASPKRPLAQLLDEASRKFDLSPAQEAWLFRALTEKPDGD